MAGKYKIHDERTEMPEGEASKYRDFSRVRSRSYQTLWGMRKRRLSQYRNRYWFLAILLIVLLLWFIFS